MLGNIRNWSYVYIVIRVKDMRNKGKKSNQLTINQLDKTTKIITKILGSFIFFSYLYFIRLTNNN